MAISKAYRKQILIIKVVLKISLLLYIALYLVIRCDRTQRGELRLSLPDARPAANRRVVPLDLSGHGPVPQAPRPKSDRLEAKQLRVCFLSKRVAILRQKSKSRGLPPKHRPAESSRWFSATGPCQVGVNRATSTFFVCIGASVPSSSLPSQRGISATAVTQPPG